MLFVTEREHAKTADGNGSFFSFINNFATELRDKGYRHRSNQWIILTEINGGKF